MVQLQGMQAQMASMLQAGLHPHPAPPGAGHHHPSFAVPTAGAAPAGVAAAPPTASTASQGGSFYKNIYLLVKVSMIMVLKC